MPFFRSSDGTETKPSPARENAKKPNRNRVRSAARDALFRPIFQTVEELALRAAGEPSIVITDAPNAPHTTTKVSNPSVIVTTLDHPCFPIVRASASDVPSLKNISPLREQLNADEEGREARFWRGLTFETPSRKTYPAQWRSTSDETRLEWFHHAISSAGAVHSFSLNLNDETEHRFKREPDAAGWMADRIAKSFKATFGRQVQFWFAVEVSDGGRVHLHGELSVSASDAKRARAALRKAGGEWSSNRRWQANTRAAPTRVPAFYAAKNAIYRRPWKRFPTAKRPPFSGGWIFATNLIRRRACDLYEARRLLVKELLKALKARKPSGRSSLPVVRRRQLEALSAWQTGRKKRRKASLQPVSPTPAAPNAPARRKPAASRAPVTVDALMSEEEFDRLLAEALGEDTGKEAPEAAPARSAPAKAPAKPKKVGARVCGSVRLAERLPRTRQKQPSLANTKNRLANRPRPASTSPP